MVEPETNPPNEEREAVGAVVVREDGRVLLIQRGRPPMAGTWTLPGGHVEPGESWAEAVTRELREETGLHVRVIAFLETVRLATATHKFAIHEHLCAPAHEDAPLTPADDAADARWVAPDELSRFDVTDAVRRVVTSALALARSIGVR